MAKTVLAELVAVFKGDTTDLDKAVATAGKSIASFGKIAASAAYAASGALATLALRQINVVGQNNDLAKSLGLTYAGLQNMSLVAREAGVEVGALGASLGFMQRSIVDAATGSESANAAFIALGLNISNLKNLTPEAQFAAIAEKISLIQNPAERTAMAMDIFGKQGRALINIFEDYGIKAAEAAAFNDRFNLSLSQVDAQKLDDAGDAMARVGLAMTGIGNTVAIELAPALSQLSNAFTNSGAASKGFAAIASAGIQLIKNNLIALNAAVGLVASAYVKAVENINNVLAKITFGDMSKRFKMQAEIAGEAFKESTSQPFVRSFSESSSSTTLGGGSSPFLATSQGADKAKDSVKDLNKELDDARKKTEDIRNSAADTFSGFVSSVGRGESAMESLRNTALNVIQDIVNNMFRLSFGGTTSGGLAGSLASGLFSALGIGGYSGGYAGPASGPPPSKPFAAGGVVSGASLFNIGGRSGMMGEKGPEAIMPLVRGAGGKLGVASAGGDSKSIVQNINITTGVNQTVRAEISRMMPQIMQAAVGAVQNANNRNILKGGAQ